jgi:hypothetical protein
MTPPTQKKDGSLYGRDEAKDALQNNLRNFLA